MDFDSRDNDRSVIVDMHRLHVYRGTSRVGAAAPFVPELSDWEDWIELKLGVKMIPLTLHGFEAAGLIGKESRSRKVRVHTVPSIRFDGRRIARIVLTDEADKFTPRDSIRWWVHRTKVYRE